MKPIGWEDRLNNYVEAIRNKPFRYGSHDCVLAALKGVESVYEVKLLSKLPKRWKSKKEALKVIRELSKNNNLLEAARPVLKDMGFVEINTAFAQRGDLVIYPASNGMTFGLCLGSTVIAPGKDGVVFNRVQGFCFRLEGVN